MRGLFTVENAPAGSVGLLFLLFMVVTPVNAFLRHLCFNPLGFGRIDPIVSPSKAAQHVHHLHGASNLGLESIDAQYLLQSNCTSCSITVDKSAYWAPAMFFEHANGSLSLMSTSSAITIYYKFEKRANFLDQNYTVFPQGFRMVAGTNSKREWVGPWPVPPQSNWEAVDTTQEALAEKAIGFNCMNYRKDGVPEPSLAFPYLRDKAFIAAHCPDGVRAELLFPSCWDGVSLDSADHKSHVAYPTLIQDGACPHTHPIFLPVLFYETIWRTQDFADLPGQFVLANGDPTGYGYHGDFISAWEDGILQRIMDDPTCTDHDLEHRSTNGIQEECSVVAASIQSQSDAAQCKLTVPEILQHEDLQGPLPILPGNLAITGVRHEPGTQEGILDGASDSVSTSLTNTDLSIELTSSSQTTGADSSTLPTISGIVTSASMVSEPASTPVVVFSTSTFVSGGTLIELVIAQEIVTKTVTIDSSATLLARHKHGHHRGRHHA